LGHYFAVGENEETNIFSLTVVISNFSCHCETPQISLGCVTLKLDVRQL